MKPNGIEWIGDIPDDWKVIRGKYTLDLLTRSTRDNDEVITCFRDGQVTLRSNRREDGFTFADKEIGYQGIRKGDLVIHGMDGFAGAIGISDSDGKGSPVLNVCRVKNKSDIRYINYYLRSLAWQNVFLAMTTGIRERSCDLRWKKIAELYFIVPPHQTQQKIADYLDEKCGEIDKTIEKQKESIEKLKAYKQSLISETVTKGLNKSTPLKPSGIKWVGYIPQDWKVSNLSSIFIEHKEKNVGLKESNLLSLSYGKIKRKDINTNEGLLPQSFETYNIIKKDDIVFRLTDLQNDKKSLRTGIATENGIITSAYVTLRSKINVISKYFYYLFHTYDICKVFYGMGDGVRQGMGFADLKKLLILIPSISEQQGIASYLDNKCDEIDSTINKKQKIIEKLDAYKKSLIFECVTGKRKI